MAQLVRCAACDAIYDYDGDGGRDCRNCGKPALVEVCAGCHQSIEDSYVRTLPNGRPVHDSIDCWRRGSRAN